MEFTIKCLEIMAATERIYPFIPKKGNSLPYEKCIKIQSANGNLFFRAFNQSFRNICFFVSKVPTDCNVDLVVDYEMLKAVLDTMDSNANISFALDGQMILIKQKRKVIRVPKLETDIMSNESQVPISQYDFQSSPRFLWDSDKISRFASDDETRPALQGICYDNGHYVATNGYVCAYIKRPTADAKITIQADLVRKIAKAFKEEDVFVASNIPNQVAIKSGLNVIVISTINRDYPKWEAVIPKTDYEIKISKAWMIDAAKTALSVCDDRKKIMKFSIDGMKVLAQSKGDTSLFEDAGQCENNSGYKVEFHVNPELLILCLEALTHQHDIATLCFKNQFGAMVPIVIKDEDICLLLMPLKA